MVASATPRRRLNITTEGAAETVENTDGESIALNDAGTEAEVEMVTAIIPKAFQLTHDDGEHTHYNAGTQEIPVEHAAHWFARAMGVKVYQPGE